MRAASLVVLFWLGLPQAQDAGLDRRVANLAHEMCCLVCQNQTIAESNAPLAALFAAAALAYVLRPLFRAGTRQSVRTSDANVAIYKDQLRELDGELAAGTLTREDHGRARLELEARLLEDVPAVEVERAAS